MIRGFETDQSHNNAPCRNHWMVVFFRTRHPRRRRQARACICRQGAANGYRANGASRIDKKTSSETGHFPGGFGGKDLCLPPDHFKLGNRTHLSRCAESASTKRCLQYLYRQADKRRREHHGRNRAENRPWPHLDKCRRSAAHCSGHSKHVLRIR